MNYLSGLGMYTVPSLFTRSIDGIATLLAQLDLRLVFFQCLITQDARVTENKFKANCHTFAVSNCQNSQQQSSAVINSIIRDARGQELKVADSALRRVCSSISCGGTLLLG